MIFRVLTVFFLFFVLGSSALAKKKGGENCAAKLESSVNEMSAWKEYGIVRNNQGVVQFPAKCTPFMRKKQFLPLGKRKTAGTNRERYLGNDCNVYEWDSQHGRFEVYKPNSNNTRFYHDGEASAVSGKVFSDKKDSKRDNDFADTGVAGVKMKELCKKHKAGQVAPNDLKRSKGKGMLKCI